MKKRYEYTVLKKMDAIKDIDYKKYLDQTLTGLELKELEGLLSNSISPLSLEHKVKKLNYEFDNFIFVNMQELKEMELKLSKINQSLSSPIMDFVSYLLDYICKNEIQVTWIDPYIIEGEKFKALYDVDAEDRSLNYIFSSANFQNNKFNYNLKFRIPNNILKIVLYSFKEFDDASGLTSNKLGIEYKCLVYNGIMYSERHYALSIDYRRNLS